MRDPNLSEAEYDAITSAATHWCMRLHAPDCTALEREAFARWRDAHPVHGVEYEAVLKVWELSVYISPVNPAPVGSDVRPATKARSRRGWAVAAVIALLVPLAGYLGWALGWLPDAYDSYEAKEATRLVTLIDGSRVELNLGTQLSFANYKDRRSVTLDKGEAFFQVSHDSAHPFVVNAGRGSVNVTGTRFNVWLYQDQVRVMLVEGALQVASDRAHPGSSLRLDPGMQASFKAGDRQPRISQTSAGDNSLAWRNGKLVINNLTLDQALPLINRYLPQPILLADNATGAIRLGVIYNTRDMASVLTSLAKVLPVLITQNSQGNPVISLRPGAAPRS
jgi:transmembrane sensor